MTGKKCRAVWIWLLGILFCNVLTHHHAMAQSLDITYANCGLSLGNSARFNGLRINTIDRNVECISGINWTLWNPDKNPKAEYNGVALGVIGTKGRRIHGLALSGIGVNAREQLNGIAAGTLGVGAGSLNGVAAGLVTVNVQRRLRGAALAGIWTADCEQLDGLALGLVAAGAKHIRGTALAGLGAGGEQSLTGALVAAGGVYSARVRGVAVGGVAAFAGDLDGFACSLGGIGGKRLDGVLLAGIGVGATQRIRGISMGSLLAFAPEVEGFSLGAFNGLYIDRIDLEDFLHFKLANQRFTGLSIGLVNYTARLRGVQIGLLNYAGNNPRWLRLLPFFNVHL